MDNKTKTPFYKNRRFKYGSLAVGLTVLLIALVVVLNAVVYALTYTNGWYLDLSGQQQFGITEASTAELDNVLTEDKEIQIIFCQDKDRVLEDSAGYYVYKCAESYKKAYPNNIKLVFVDIVKNPEVAKEYLTKHGETLSPDTVIIESRTVDKADQKEGYVYDSVRVVNYTSFFVFDQDTSSVYAFKGELTFTSHIVSLCHGSPICYFTTGNGETISASDSSGNIFNCALAELLSDAGFIVKDIDLDDPTATLTDAKVVVMNNPTFDITDDEYTKLNQFMSDKRGGLMVFLSPEAMSQTEGNSLSNLTAFLSEWGISVLDGTVNDVTNSLTPDGLSVVTDYPTTGFAASLHKHIRENVGTVPKTIINSPLAFSSRWDNNASGQRELSWLLHSHTTAKLGIYENEMFDLAAIIRNVDVEGEREFESYMLVTSTGLVNDSYLRSNAYGNRDIILSLASEMAKVLVVKDIDYAVFANQELTITTGEAYLWTVLLVAVIPAIVLVAGGTVCFIRRKRF